MAKNIADGDIIWTQRKRNWCRTPFTFTTYTLTAVSYTHLTLPTN